MRAYVRSAEVVPSVVGGQLPVLCTDTATIANDAVCYLRRVYLAWVRDQIYTGRVMVKRLRSTK